MEGVYCNVSFKKCGTRETGDGETSKVGPCHSDLTRPDDPAHPLPEPESKVKMAGQTKERLLWISLCTLLFAVALIIGVLYAYNDISHNENVHQLTEKLLQYNDTLKNFSIIEKRLSEKDELIKQLQMEKTNLSSDVEDKEKKIQQLQTEKEKQTCDPQSPNVDKACCADGWKYFRGKCYYFSDDEKTWTASRDACVAAGGDLVIIRSTEEQDFIKRSKPGEGEQRYWVALTDAVDEGVWRWLDGTRLSQTPKYWTGNEPDNWKGENSQYPEGEDCALMALTTDSYVLMDAFCDVEEKKRVCEAKAAK